ncbi:metal-dependent hydrolase [Natrialbaceae archaeon AArc-T1-2]|uniref:metal-dependent hydrolase n=1 Tax=Natrialbaceae archaeon AArc-T1-2 TaxID=3053904 RepID=UPI00255B1D99|nr:metal-dependent hydrolase [Natrialbaceae archaeon AArc-T1-2]WIV68836.1 metal-dependent hydrolase [Natrialbaceae archaeon AArc-T1-2]
MLVSGHLGVGYLVYAAFRRVVGWVRPDRLVILAVCVGALFPDLVDKPLAWELGILASGRSLGHSLLTATVVILLVMPIAAEYDRVDAGAAFSLGYLSHIAADAYTAVLASGSTTFLFWPLGPWSVWEGGLWVPPQYSLAVNWTVLVVALGVWLLEGAPGLGRVG